MKKFILSIFIMGSFGLYVLWQGQASPSSAYIAPQPVVAQNNNPYTNLPNSAPAVTDTYVPPTDQTNNTPVENTPPPTPKPVSKPTPPPVIVPKKNRDVYRWYIHWF